MFMHEISEYSEIDHTKSVYVRVTSAPENFLAGWTDGSGQAIALARSAGTFLYFSKGSNPSFYARAIMAAATKLGEIKEVTVHSELAAKLSPKDTFPWVWMTKFDKELPDFSQLNLETITDARLNNQIHAFTVRSGFDAHFLPGHPEIEFWVVAWNSEKTAIQAVAAGSQRISGERVVNTVLVAPHLRGQGLGKLITAAAASEIFNRGAGQVHLGVKGMNKIARNTYAALGFELVEELVAIES